MPKVTRKKKLATRRALVVAAGELILESGLDGCSVAAVTGRVGVSPGALYSNFETLTALHAEAVVGMVEQRSPVLDDTRPLPEAVQAYVAEYLALWADPTLEPLLRAQVSVTANLLGSGDTRALLTLQDPMLDAVGARLARSAQVGGRSLLVGEREAAMLFLGMVNGVGNPMGVDPDLAPPELLVGAILRALLGEVD